ncbi:hypothetical protein MPSD_29330 [Mycobacterium pseudoshottsii JCM 15466]|uniref:Uncharacterized protein n=1 Tax=Mycobacterium pseudoshottsii TaxID=265949 RepID=A0A9N7QL42_9MYCO|nr:hypothetical protein MPSD_29330 [Mycobacterium pseudoshottsii JCM 15466]BDN82658.1 hypothetical protein NJB1907Z4_C28730 [Mycobacterium pseudoshottsii]
MTGAGIGSEKAAGQMGETTMDESAKCREPAGPRRSGSAAAPANATNTPPRRVGQHVGKYPTMTPMTWGANPLPSWVLRRPSPTEHQAALTRHWRRSSFGDGHGLRLAGSPGSHSSQWICVKRDLRATGRSAEGLSGRRRPGLAAFPQSHRGVLGVCCQGLGVGGAQLAVFDDGVSTHQE